MTSHARQAIILGLTVTFLVVVIEHVLIRDEFFVAYQNVLDNELGFDTLVQVFLFSQLVDEIQAFCEQLEQFDGDPFQFILNQVSAFCHSFTPAPGHDPTSPEIELCISLFHDLIEGFADDGL